MCRHARVEEATCSRSFSRCCFLFSFILRMAHLSLGRVCPNLAGGQSLGWMEQWVSQWGLFWARPGICTRELLARYGCDVAGGVRDGMALCYRMGKRRLFLIDNMDRRATARAAKERGIQVA